MSTATSSLPRILHTETHIVLYAELFCWLVAFSFDIECGCLIHVQGKRSEDGSLTELTLDL